MGPPNGSGGGSSGAAAGQPERSSRACLHGRRAARSAPPGSGETLKLPGPTLDGLGGWPAVLARLVSGGHLTEQEARAAMADILEGNATPAQIAAFIFGMRCKGETVEEMTGLVGAMIDAADRVLVPDSLADRLVDTCGTGGDRSGTINVSTIAALVVAGAGVPVCKHGGRASSSKAGSADVLEALGVAIDLGPMGVARCIEEAGIGFCFAPRYHPAMRHAVPVRRELGVPTAFNFLGPLANPARVRRQVVGVGDPAMAEKMTRVLAAGGSSHVLVVFGADGLDELSTTGPSTMYEYREDPGGGGAGGSGGSGGSGGGGAGGSGGSGGSLEVRQVLPGELGLAPARLADLLGGDVDTNARMARKVLGGERGPHRDIVLLNAAAGLLVGGIAGDLAEGVALAAESIDGGAAAVCLDRLVSVSSALAGS